MSHPTRSRLRAILAWQPPRPPPEAGPAGVVYWTYRLLVPAPVGTLMLAGLYRSSAFLVASVISSAVVLLSGVYLVRRPWG